MDAGENRWNTTFVREFSKALDEVEKDDGPGALVTCAKDPKFFSNGLDLDWVKTPANHPEGGDREVFGEEFMFLMGRMITLPIPSICAINGNTWRILKSPMSYVIIEAVRRSQSITRKPCST